MTAVDIQSLPMSPIAVPHPFAALQELIIDAETMGHQIAPTKEMIEESYEAVRMGSDCQAVRQLLENESDNKNVLRKGSDAGLKRFQEWIIGTSDAAIEMAEDGAMDAERIHAASLSAIQQLERLRFVLGAGVLFESKTTLDDALAQTDIGSDIPASFFKLPYPHIYLRLGEGLRGFEIPLPSRIHGSRVFVDGCYLREIAHSEGGRDIVVTATMRCTDVPRSFSVPYNIITIAIRDESVTLDHLLDQLFWRLKLASNTDAVHFLKELIFHVAKILLYLGAERAEERQIKERKEAVAKFNAAGAKKQGKLGRKTMRAYDRIVVGPEVSATTGTNNLGSGPEISAHWRRGHFRNQAHGPAHSLRKLVWVQPVLVNAAAVGEIPPNPKNYLVSPS
jgi:hypothetical protein